MPYCDCGCGNWAESSRFIRGHAIRLAVRLQASAADGDQGAIRQLSRLGWTDWGRGRSRYYPTGPIKAPKKFGVEAEFIGMNPTTAAILLKDAGLNAMNDGYHHDTKDYWRVTTDSSVTGNGGERDESPCGCGEDGCDEFHEPDYIDNDEEGCELVSPPLLPTDDLYWELTLACRTLRDNGGEVNNTCGVHIHHSADHMTIPAIVELFKFYEVAQPYINRCISRGRELSNYAAPLEGGWWSRYVETFSSVNALKHNNDYQNRYLAINIAALALHNTLEFRQHEGTLNAGAIINWARLTRMMMQVKDRHHPKMGLSDIGSVEDMLTYLKAPGDVARHFLRKERRTYGIRTSDPDSE